MTNLLDVPPDWVTLRAETPEGNPIVVLIDRAIATTVPYDIFTMQVAIAVPLGETRDGLPAESDKENLRTLEQGMVDMADGEGRLVAVMTLEGIREWMFYARTTEWCRPFVEAGLSVKYAEDPTFSGLLELSGAAG
ncbi:MAG: DUF695 domain-containing protein [Mycobacteriales bacterium]